MTDTQKEIDSIRSTQATIDVLLNLGMVSDKSAVKAPASWILDTLYNESDCTLGFAQADDSLAEFPSHCHNGSIEYLIVAKGKIMFILAGIASRIVSVGECVSIPKNAIHVSKPLEKGTKLIYICVPFDSNFGGSKLCQAKI